MWFGGLTPHFSDGGDKVYLTSGLHVALISAPLFFTRMTEGKGKARTMHNLANHIFLAVGMGRRVHILDQRLRPWLAFSRGANNAPPWGLKS